MASVSATTSSDALGASASPSASRERGREALVPYVTAGHPDVARSRRAAARPRGGRRRRHRGRRAVLRSDGRRPGHPGELADARSSMACTFDRRARDRARDARLGMPVVLFSYLNPLMRGGRAMRSQRAAGRGRARRARRPTCRSARIRSAKRGSAAGRSRSFGSSRRRRRSSACARSRSMGSGFVYLISRLRRDRDAQRYSRRIFREPSHGFASATTLPICVGFGISAPSRRRPVARLADGIVVGSAIVRRGRRAASRRPCALDARRCARGIHGPWAEMTRFLALYARLVASLGTILLVAALIIDPRWMDQPIAASWRCSSRWLPHAPDSAHEVCRAQPARHGRRGRSGHPRCPRHGVGFYVGVLFADWPSCGRTGHRRDQRRPRSRRAVRCLRLSTPGPRCDGGAAERDFIAGRCRPSRFLFAYFVSQRLFSTSRCSSATSSGR